MAACLRAFFATHEDIRVVGIADEAESASRQFLIELATLSRTTSYLDAVQFIPLPDFIRALSENQINRIH